MNNILGFIGQQGLQSDNNSLSVNQLQKVLMVILQKRSDVTKKGKINSFYTLRSLFLVSVTLAIQIAAVDSLLELCPQSHPNQSQVYSTLSQWLQSLYQSTTTMHLASEYCSKLTQLRTVPPAS